MKHEVDQKMQFYFPKVPEPIIKKSSLPTSSSEVRQVHVVEEEHKILQKAKDEVERKHAHDRAVNRKGDKKKQQYEERKETQLVKEYR